MITSTSNSRIKEVRRLQSSAQARRESKAFVIEGLRLAQEAAAAHWPATLVLHIPELDDRGQALLAVFRQAGAVVESVTEQVLRSVSDTQNPQGVLVVLTGQPLSPPAETDFVLILDSLSDPGNLGTILRTAAAAGVQLAVLGPGCADPYAPKVLRAGMGAHFRLPLRQEKWETIQERCRQGDYPTAVYLAESSGSLPYTAANFRQPFTLIIGSEAHGSGRQAQALARERVYIPMHRQVESLNAATATAILLFEAVRQRTE